MRVFIRIIYNSFLISRAFGKKRSPYTQCHRNTFVSTQIVSDADATASLCICPVFRTSSSYLPEEDIFSRWNGFVHLVVFCTHNQYTAACCSAPAVGVQHLCLLTVLAVALQSAAWLAAQLVRCSYALAKSENPCILSLKATSSHLGLPNVLFFLNSSLSLSCHHKFTRCLTEHGFAPRMPLRPASVRRW